MSEQAPEPTLVQKVLTTVAIKVYQVTEKFSRRGR